MRVNKERYAMEKNLALTPSVGETRLLAGVLRQAQERLLGQKWLEVVVEWRVSDPRNFQL